MRLILFIFLWTCVICAAAQTVNSAYVKALYQQYPARNSDLCPACKLWINPYYCSVGDTVKHQPVVTYYVYTQAHRLQQEAADLPRTGINASWHPVYGQPDESSVYKVANQSIGHNRSAEMIAKGHCQAWILMAWCTDAAILSDTYTFNAGMEFQGQNVGTEIATEELCRTLTGFKTAAVTDSVHIWCGTFGSQQVYTKGTISVTVPSHYYKIIRYRDLHTHEQVRLCYWMPNQPTEKKKFLYQRQVTHEILIANLGFDPEKIFTR